MGKPSVQAKAYREHGPVTFTLRQQMEEALYQKALAFIMGKVGGLIRAGKTELAVESWHGFLRDWAVSQFHRREA